MYITLVFRHVITIYSVGDESRAQQIPMNTSVMSVHNKMIVNSGELLPKIVFITPMRLHCMIRVSTTV